MSDIVERLRETRCDREPFTPEHAVCICRLANEAADEIERLREALRIVALRSHDVVLTEPVDWKEVANTFVAVARGALGPTAELVPDQKRSSEP